MQVRIDFYVDDVAKYFDDIEDKIYKFLNTLEVENVIISNEEDNPEVFI